MDVIGQEAIGDFFTFVRDIKHNVEAWKVIEIRLSSEATDLYTIEDIVKKILNIYAKKRGKVLVCNAHEILIVFNPGAKTSTTVITKKISNALPDHACYIDVGTLSSGVAKIQLNINSGSESQTDIEKERSKKVHGQILIIEKNNPARQILRQTLERYGEVTECDNIADGIKLYLEKPPHIVFLNEDLSTDDKMDFMVRVLKYDPRAYVILVGEDNSTDGIMNAYERRAKSYLLTPPLKTVIQKTIEACPFFTHMIPSRATK